MKLTKKIMLFEAFEETKTKVETKEASVKSTEVATEVADRDSVRTDIVKNVDSIIKGLETLTVQIHEGLVEIDSFLLKESNAINEAEDNGLKMIMDVAFVAGKLAKMQAKVNKMKMNSADLEFAAGALNSKEQADKKANIMAKKKQLDVQVKELQGMLDTKVKERTSYAERRVNKTKIEGQIALIKATSGMSDNPDEKKELKDRMKGLADRYKEEEAALKQLEDKAQEEGEKQKDANEEKLEKAKEAKKQIPKENKLELSQADMQIAELEIAIAAAKGDKASVDAGQEKMVRAEEKIKELETKAKESGEEGTSGKSEEGTSGTSGKSEEGTSGTSGKSEGTSGTSGKSEEGTSGTSGKSENPKVKQHEDKIKEIEDAIESLKGKKDKKSKNNIGVLQAALKSEKDRLAKAKEESNESMKYVDSIADRFRKLL